MAIQTLGFKTIIGIKNKIVTILDNNQDIKRYLVYLTDCPLAKRGKLEDGTMIEQPDIKESLINSHIIPYQDYDKVISTNKALILVHLAEGDLSDNFVAKHVLSIDIICPTKENMNVGDIGQERIAAIADFIADTINTENKNKSIANKIRFGDYSQYRIAKSPDYIGMTLFLSIETSNMESYKNRR